MAESTYEYAILDTSPLIKYSPFVVGDLASGGWMSTCPTFVQGQTNTFWICDRGSAHTTATGGINIEFDFSGVGIKVFGNITGGFGYDVTIDKATITGNPKGNTLAAFSNLNSGQHHFKLTTKHSNEGATLTFTSANITASTGLVGATIQKTYIDDSDSRVIYDVPLPGNWTVNPIYGGTLVPDPTQISSSTYHESFSADASATLKFQGAGILAYGACYSHSRYATYQATIDNEAPSDWDGTINLYDPNGQVKQRSGNCLRYARTGLDPTVQHTLKLNTKDPGRLAVDWYEVFGVTGGTTYQREEDPTVNGSGKSVPLGAIIGAACGGAALILLLIGLWIWYRRRKQQKEGEVPPTMGQMDTSPFSIAPANIGYDPHANGSRYSESVPNTAAANASFGGNTSTSSFPLSKQAMLQVQGRQSYADSSSNGVSDALLSPGAWSAGLPSGAASPTHIGYDPSSYFRDSTAGSSSAYAASSSASGGGDYGRKGQIREGGVLRFDNASPAMDAPPAYDAFRNPPPR